jgi:hypothetical protein
MQATEEQVQSMLNGLTYEHADELTRTDLARALGISRSTLWRGQNGRTGHLHKTVVKIEKGVERLNKRRG